MKKLFALIFGIAMLVSCSAYKSTLPPDGGEFVNVGYGSVDQKNLTAAVSKVKPKATEAVVYDNMYDYLRGRVPGVVVGAGDPPKITIRGLGSISSATDPLIIVDGVEHPDLSMVDPAFVESVEVIKDGTSAIYGNRGANGVILITTKH